MKSEESFMTNMTKFYVINILINKPAHGYEIIGHLKKITGKNISAGQIYPLLRELEKKKLVKTKSIMDGRREKKVYTLTPEGKKFSRGLLLKFGTLVDIAIKPRLTACAHCGCEIYKGGFEKVSNGVKRMYCCKYCAQH